MIELYTDCENALLELDLSIMDQDLLIHNSVANPASIIYLSLPEADLNWPGSTVLDGASAELVVFTKSKPNILNHKFEKFSCITFSNKEYKSFIDDKILDDLETKITQIEVSKNDEDAIKSSEKLIDEIKELNNGNNHLLDKLDQFYNDLQDIIHKSEKDSSFFPQGLAIKEWGAKEIFQWSQTFKKTNVNKNDILNEAIAVAVQAIVLFKGYQPRDIQILSSLILLNKAADQGRLLQVKTGEGKTIICAMSAAITSLLKNETVDIITSSSVLAERDDAEMKKYYSLFGLTCSHISKSHVKGGKDCYRADIVYGDASDFQGDYLRDHFKGLGTRAGREFKNVIVDEVDSMLIDEGAKITKLSSPRPGTEYLAPIFILIWKFIETIEITDELLSNEVQRKNLQEQIEDRIKFIIDSDYFTFPRYLYDYINSQITQWAKSAITASELQEKIHYIIARDEDLQIDVIAPVDYINSGVIQSRTNWSDGLHQFLQVKHLLRMSAESLTTSFISNMSFFLKYGKNIMGMSGTLGSEDSKTLLSDQYNLDIVIIPKFKKDLFYQNQPILAPDTDSYKESILDSAISEAESGRVVLIICQNISFTEQLAELLKNHYDHNKIFLYNRNDISEGNWQGRTQTAGNIIIATNLAGRGTDIKLSDEVNKNGGLHVILTMLPGNLRVEEQAMGRTAREGNPGSAQIIINISEVEKTFGFHLDQIGDVVDYKFIRDLIETRRLKEIKEVRLKKIAFEDRLFSRFNDEVYQFLRQSNNNIYKLEQLEENWGFWLREQKSNVEDAAMYDKILADFEKFKTEQIEIYNSQAPTHNPAYQIQTAHSKLGDDGYDETIRLLEAITSFDDPYSFAGNYYLAYAYLRKNLGGKASKNGGAENKPEFIAKAFENLVQAHHYVEDVLITELQALQLFLGVELNGSELGKQIFNKIDLLNIQLNYIKNALQYLQSHASGKNIITIGDNKNSLEDFFDSDKAPKLEIQELHRLGVLNLYELDAKKPPKDLLSSAVVVIVGLGQVIIGTLAVMATGGAIGIGTIISGLHDVYLGIDCIIKGEGVDLKAYFKEKAISLAIDLVSGFAANLLIPMKGMQAINALSTTQVLKQVGIKIGMKLLTDQAVKVAVKELCKTAFKKSIGGEIKKATRLIEERLNSVPTKDYFENIIAVNSLCRNENYKRSIEAQVSHFFSVNKEEIELIVSQVISATVSKTISNAGGSGVIGTGTRIALESANMGVQVARAADKIGKMADHFSNHMSSKIIEVGSNLPSNKEILVRITSGGLTENQAHNLERHLTNAGIFTGPWQMESSLVVKSASSQQLLKAESVSNNPVQGREATSAISGQRQTTAMSIIADRKANMSVVANLPVTTVVANQEAPTPAILKTEPVKTGADNLAKPYTPAVKYKHLDELEVGGDLKNKMRQIRTSVRAMEKAYSSRGHLSDPIIHSYAEIMAAKMRGEIKSGIVKPVVAQVAGIGFAALEATIIEYVTPELYAEAENEVELEGQARLRELEEMANSISQIEHSGVAGGEHDEQNEQSFLANRAEEVILLAQKYQEFATEYPWLAENGLQCIAGALKIGFVAATGGAGMGVVLTNEVRSRILEAAAGDLIATGINSSIETAKEWFVKLDSTLTNEQSQALATTAVLATIMASGGSGDIKAYGPAIIKSIGKSGKTGGVKLKLPDSNIHNSSQDHTIYSKKHDVSGTQPSSKLHSDVHGGKTKIDHKEFEHFKKKDGSGRYECEAAESPIWKETKAFKGEYRTNGEIKEKYIEYYRWDGFHKDIEVYDNKGRYLGSKDPVTGEMYRVGDMKPNRQIEKIL